MTPILSVIKRTPLLGGAAVFGFRVWIAAKHLGGQVATSLKWLVSSSETTNLTYDLSDLNKRHLAAMLAVVTGQPQASLLAYIQELENDSALAAHIRERTLASPDRSVADPTPRYGRRLGWYALVRATKPNVVVETGIDKGLGACVITAALRRNAEEGHGGRYYGTDINPHAGYLLHGAYAEHGEILYGDSVASLTALNAMIDLFINDSDHSAEYEALEYQTIRDKLSADALVLGDNAHVTDTLLDFANDSGRHFLFFAERPLSHWYPGAGIGIAFKSKQPSL
ncbi:class I SAM-dependent methyltransferase [Methylomagnum sp.]